MKSLKSVSVFFLVLMPVVWGSISVADERSKGPAAADDSQVTSIILLQSAPPAIAETELADLVEKAWCLKLSVVSDKAKPESGAEFIQKTEAGFQIGTKQVRVMITTANTPYVSADDIQTVDDLRCRKMLQDHRAWISVEAFSEAAFTDALKLAAELVNKDTLGMWVEVTSVSKDTVRGKLANEPVWSKDLRIGDEVTRKVSELTDWLYLTDGQIVGGYTVKVLTMPQEESEK